MKLGTRIREAREGRGWSQARLGEEVGAGQGAVSRIESGDTQPTAPTLRRYAEALDVSADYLLGLTARTSPTGSRPRPRQRPCTG